MSLELIELVLKPMLRRWRLMMLGFVTVWWLVVKKMMKQLRGVGHIIPKRMVGLMTSF